MKPVKPTKTTLSRSYILQVALELLDQEDLQKFTMRKLGQEMSVSPMAVYRYFPNQEALFDGLVEMLWQRVLVLDQDAANATWQDQVTGLMSRLRQTLLAHPNILPLISTRPLSTHSEFALVEKILTIWTTKGLAIQPTTVFLINSLTAYTLGFVWTEAVNPQSMSELEPNLLSVAHPQSDLLNQFMQPIREQQFTSDEQFLMGIQALLAGWKKEN